MVSGHSIWLVNRAVVLNSQTLMGMGTKVVLDMAWFAGIGQLLHS